MRSGKLTKTFRKGIRSRSCHLHELDVFYDAYFPRVALGLLSRKYRRCLLFELKVDIILDVFSFPTVFSRVLSHTTAMYCYQYFFARL